MKGTLKVLDRTGHTATAWDTEVNDGTKLDPKWAHDEFDRLVKSGALAFDTSKEPGEPIQKFDPEKHIDVTLVPQFVGG